MRDFVTADTLTDDSLTEALDAAFNVVAKGRLMRGEIKKARPRCSLEFDYLPLFRRGLSVQEVSTALGTTWDATYQARRHLSLRGVL